MIDCRRRVKFKHEQSFIYRYINLNSVQIDLNNAKSLRPQFVSIPANAYNLIKHMKCSAHSLTSLRDLGKTLLAIDMLRSYYFVFRFILFSSLGSQYRFTASKFRFDDGSSCTKHADAVTTATSPQKSYSTSVTCQSTHFSYALNSVCKSVEK